MRRVFPLRQSENCGYGGQEVSLRKLPDQLEEANINNKLQGDAFIEKLSDDTETQVKKVLSSRSSSGDENLPAANVINSAAVRPLSNQKPPRASVHPIFTAKAPQRYNSQLSGVSLDKARSNLSTERQCPASLDSQAYQLAKDSKNQNQHERPLSAPKNRPFPDTFPQQISLRTQSLRLSPLPADTDSILDDEDVEGTSHTTLDRRSVLPSFHTRSFSQVESDRSILGLSNFSGVFTKAVENSASRTLTSESPSSERSSVGGKPGRGSSPFKYLSARMVAEKLVKVLGKERLRPQLNRPNSSQVLQERSGDISYVVAQEQAVSPAPTGQNMYSTGSSIPAGCQANQNTTRSMDVGLENQICNRCADNHFYGGENTTNARLAENDVEPYSARMYKLEGKALVREEPVNSLDKETNILERKCVSGSLADHPVEVTVQGLKDLKHEIRKLHKKKKELALEVANETRARITNQKAPAEQLVHLKSEMEAKVSAVGKDKQILQENLEKEIDNRGAEWNAKLERMRLEERRMRERAKQMAEDQAELQKIVAAYKEREAYWMSEAKDFECSLSNLKQKIKMNEAEMGRQIQASAETLTKLKASEGELKSFSRRNAYLEMENLEMQKELIRLQRLCNDQEVTIEGLCHELDEAVNVTFEHRSESLLRLQRELLRLAGIEQRLRNELNTTQAELIRLKQDKDVALVGTPADVEMLNQELQEKVDKLQAKSALLQEENKKLSLSLREAVRARRDAERALKLSQFEESNCTTENLRAAERAVDEGNALISRKERDEFGKSFYLRSLSSKLQLREAELELLNKEIFDIINARNVLQTEVADLHRKLTTANQQICDLERQVNKKEEMVEVLLEDGEKYKKELANLQAELPQIRLQRDEMHKKAEDISREALKLSRELNEVRRTAEKLEEEVMLKEGQISILRGTYTNCEYLC